MLKTLRARVKRDKEPRILILGLDNAGKTTILNKMAGAELQATEGPTQGFNQTALNVTGRTMRMCDLGGQRTLRDFWKDYYDNTDCLMFVIDSSDIRRIEEAFATFKDVIETTPKVPVLVYANKQDLKNSKTPDVIAEVLQLVELRDRKWQIQGCSAKTGEGLEDGLLWILQCC